MNITTNQLALLAFNRIPLIGPRTIIALWQRWPNLYEIFQWDLAMCLNAGLSTAVANMIINFDHHLIEQDLMWQAEKSQYNLLTLADVNYPKLLREIHSPPLVLYANGDLSCLNKPTIAIIGTRKPSTVGRNTAWQFALELANVGITIVSGLALGIDAAAHQGCLHANGKTVAVFGTGIDKIYPQPHILLARNIAESGLILSEFPLHSAPSAGHFPRRNRIISGLSLATLVVEAAFKSGSLITARLALEQNREVFAVPGSIHNPQSRGCHYLLRQGAMLVTSTQDILRELNIVVPDVCSIQCKMPVYKNCELIQYIGFETTTVDQLLESSGLTLSVLLHKLAELELNGIVQAVAGGYVRC